MKRVIAVIIVLALAGRTCATVIDVPLDYLTIQGGIDASVNGDTVRVADGHYFERINFRGKTISVLSEYAFDSDTAHILNTIIDSDTLVLGTADTGSVVCFVSGEQAGTLLQGFTIMGGTGMPSGRGGGMYCQNANAEVRNCIITGNTADYGGGVCCYDWTSELALVNCEILGNHANNGGGALMSRAAALISMDSCGVKQNTGGGFWIDWTGRMSWKNCVIEPAQNVTLDEDEGGRLTVDSCYIDSIVISSISTLTQTTISHSTLLNCEASGYGDLFLTDDTLVDSYVGTADNFDSEAGTHATKCALIRSGIRNYSSVAVIDSCYVEHGIVDTGETPTRLIVMNSTVREGIRTHYTSTPIIDNSIVNGDVSLWEPYNTTRIENSTIFAGAVKLSSYGYFNDRLDMVNSIVVSEDASPIVLEGPPLSQPEDLILDIDCCDFYSLVGSEWLSTDLEPLLDTNHVYFWDPLFCDTGAANYELYDNSPCAAANNECGVIIGALDVGCFAPPTFTLTEDYDAGLCPSSIYSGDLDGDGDRDLAVTNSESDDVSILTNNGDGTFATAVDYAVNDEPTSVCGADFDSDGDKDLAVANNGSDNVSILGNHGDATFEGVVDYGVGSGPRSVFTCDLNGDSEYDLAVANSDSDDLSILLNTGDGTFATAVNYAVGDYPVSVFSADLDGDIDKDVAVANYYSNTVSVLINHGNATFEGVVDYGVGSGPRSVFVCDLDNDGDRDVVTANGDSDDISVLLNYGDATFATAVSYPAGDSPHSIYGGDIDGDGDKDLVVANYNSDSVSILINHGDATFEGVIDYGVGSGPRAVCLTDVDGDLVYDIVTANSLSDDVSVLINESDEPVYGCELRGDFNRSGQFDILDIDDFIDYLFRDGLPPACEEEADVNDSGQIDILDIDYMIDYLFRDGPEPIPCP